MNKIYGTILFEGRSGSSHLSSLINQHKDATFYGEVLASYKEKGWSKQHEWLKTLCSPDNRETMELKLVGFKTKTREILDKENFITFLKEKKFRIIRLYRKNLFKQVLSAIRADRLREQKGIFNIKSKETTSKIPPITINIEELQYWYHIMSRYEQDVDDFILKTDNHRLLIAYEDLLYDKNKTLAQICDFFEIDSFTPQDVYTKHTSDNWEEDVLNYQEVKHFCEGTRLANYL